MNTSIESPTGNREALLRAIELAGSQVNLAAGIRSRMAGSKVSQGHISRWLYRVKGPVPPADCVIAIAAAVDFKVTPHELRRDLYPNPTDGLPNMERSAT